MNNAPTLDDVRAWLSLDEDDHMDDVVLSESLSAALDQQSRVVAYPLDQFSEQTFTADLREAVFLRTQRLAARRNSPDAVVGLTLGSGDFVSARLPAYDPDVVALESPYRTIPVC